jgi:hypothetical protein
MLLMIMILFLLLLWWFQGVGRVGLDVQWDVGFALGWVNWKNTK